MFAQESGMDIQDDKDFAALPEVAKRYQACKERDLTIAEREYLKGARDAWQAAKAQAVPNVQQALNDRLLVRSIKEQVESHIAEISVNDLFDKGWFAAMKCIQSNIDMLEAREQSHE